MHRLPALLLMASTAAAFAQARPLATPAVDRELFRDGEVQRLDQTFAGWQMVCDDIRRLHQRFCSMRARAFDGRGNPVADFVISTSDSGAPAALVTLAHGVVLSEPVLMALAVPGKAPQPVAKLGPAVCLPDGCKMVWTLGPATINALRAGVDVAVNFKSARTPAFFPVRAPRRGWRSTGAWPARDSPRRCRRR